MSITTKQVKSLLSEYFASNPPELTDEAIEAILAKAPQVEASEQFNERAMKRMKEAQRVRELKQELITRRGGKYR